MSRLIDADALIKDIDYSADMGGALGKVVECVKYYAKYMIATAPTIEERKKGFWYALEKGDKGYSASDFKCSVCGEPNHTWITKPNFCPDCGAEMERRNQ